MDNKDIEKVLTFQFDDIKKKLQKTKLTNEFKTFIRNLKVGHIFGNSPDKEFINILKNHSKNESSNKLIPYYIDKIDKLDIKAVKAKFKKSIDSFKNFISEYDNCQTVIIEYDSFDDKKAFCNGFPFYKIEEIKTPRYLDEEVDWDETLFEAEEFIDFESCWFDIEELEFTTIGLSAYYDMQKLIQLKSILILHETFKEMENEGAFNNISRRICLLINEHDCESNFLYVIN